MAKRIACYKIWAYLEVAYSEEDDTEGDDLEYEDLSGPDTVGGDEFGVFHNIAQAQAVFNAITNQQIAVPTEHEIRVSIGDEEPQPPAPPSLDDTSSIRYFTPLE